MSLSSIFDKIFLVDEVLVATAYEKRKALEAKKEQPYKIAGKAYGAATQIAVSHVRGGFTASDVLAGLIEAGSAAAVMARQYFRDKRRAKRAERRQKAYMQIYKNTDEILSLIQDTGDVVIEEHGIDPTTPEFEKILKDNLYQKVGYQGYCNATVWMPGSKPGPGRMIWFIAKNGGRTVTPVNMGAAIPPNFAVDWYIDCRGMRDRWAGRYQDLLIDQGRLQELEAFQRSYKKGITIIRVVFGLILTILFVMAIRYSLKIKKVKIRKGRY
jgi:hypothetical protein